MKKFLAILAAGTMLIGTTANAMVMEETFFDNYNHMANGAGWIGWTNLTSNSHNSSNDIRFEANIVDGALVFGSSNTAIYVSTNDKPSLLEKVFVTTEITPAEEEGGEETVTKTYNDIATGKTTISFDARGYRNGTNQVWGTDVNGVLKMYVYTGTEDNYSEMFSIVIGRRPFDARIDDKNDNRLSGYSAEDMIVDTEWKNVSFTIDHDKNTISLDNVKDLTGQANNLDKNRPYTFAAEGYLAKPITKIAISHKDYGFASNGLMAIDNFKVVNKRDVDSEDGTETVTTTLVDEDFEGIKSLDDVDMSGNSIHYFRTANSIGVLNNLKPTKTTEEQGTKDFVLEKKIETLPKTGKAVFEYSMKTYKADGTPACWNGEYSQNIPMFAVGKSLDDTRTIVAGYTSYNIGTQDQAQYVNFYGYKPTSEDVLYGKQLQNAGMKTNAATGNWGKEITDMRVVLDLDNSTYNVYYKDAANTYVQLNSRNNVPFNSTEAIDTIWFGAYHTKNHKYEISDLTAYTIDASGKQTPVVVKDDAEVSTITAGDKVTVYAPIEGDTEYASLIIAAYNEDGKMVDCKIEEAGAEITGFELLKKAYTMPEGAVTMKAFIWDGVGDLTPYAANAVLTAPVAEVPAE